MLASQMQCFPLYSLLLAIGKLLVDYLSLDIEGTELKAGDCGQESQK